MEFPGFDLRGKVALVTGGTKGIGFGMAKALAQYGAKLAITGRNAADGEEALHWFRGSGTECRFIRADVTDPAQVNQMVDEVTGQFGKLDILVNNAGMNIRKPLLEVDEKDWDDVLSTNLKGVFLVGQAAARQMTRQRFGRIVNVSSIFGGVGGPFQTSYAASKGGVVQLTKVWAAELGPYGINVNAIAPGYIRTPMTEAWLNDPKRYEEIVGNTLLGRIGEMSDLAGPIVFLASDASAYITGHVLYVEGGWLAK